MPIQEQQPPEQALALYREAASLAGSPEEKRLALSGLAMQDAHTGHETASLSDIQDGAWWLSHFIPLALNLVPEAVSQFALDR